MLPKTPATTPARKPVSPLPTSTAALIQPGREPITPEFWRSRTYTGDGNQMLCPARIVDPW